MRALAKEVGVSLAVVREAERGRRPQPANALRLAEFHGVAVSDLWNDQPTNKKGPAAASTPGTVTNTPQEGADAQER